MPLKRKKCVKATKFENHCTEFRLSEKSSFNIGLVMLEKLWEESTKANKDPLLVLGIRRNDNELFIVTGKLTIEKQKRRIK